MSNYKIVLLFFLIIVIIEMHSCATAKRVGRSQKSKLHKLFMKSLAPKDKKMLNRLKCRFNTASSPQKNEDGYAGWTMGYLRCQKSEEIINSVLCDKRCRDPIKCKPLGKQFKTKPVMIGQTITDFNNLTNAIRLPVSCQCISKKRCKGPKSNLTRGE
ncbi:uncharacterized protein LOC143450581 [Clavelina lepadiformis]|uniref:uncharacterized protein LOC143450581 n=1 Tax=Clavelina lepadiformis TaxID=159417 RepID=UPI00404394AE